MLIRVILDLLKITNKPTNQNETFCFFSRSFFTPAFFNLFDPRTSFIKEYSLIKRSAPTLFLIKKNSLNLNLFYKIKDIMVRTAGSKSFSPGETQLLLDVVEKIRPLGRQRWEMVSAEYNELVVIKDWCARDSDALKRRFMVLAYAKKPSEEWRDFMDRAGLLQHSILEEAGANSSLGSLISMPNLVGDLDVNESDDIDHGLPSNDESEEDEDDEEDDDSMLLLTEGEAEMVHSAQGTMPGFDEDYLQRVSQRGGNNDSQSSSLNSPFNSNNANLNSTSLSGGNIGGNASATALLASHPSAGPMIRTGKRGRPPGSTTGSAAKRLAMHMEQVNLLSRAVIELQKQLREVRDALATVVETQSNQSAILNVLHQQFQNSGIVKKNIIVSQKNDLNDSNAINTTTTTTSNKDVYSSSHMM